MKMYADADGIPADVVGRVLHFHSTASHFSPQNWFCNHHHHHHRRHHRRRHRHHHGGEYDDDEDGDHGLDVSVLLHTFSDASIGVSVTPEELCEIMLDSSSRLAPGGSRWL